LRDYRLKIHRNNTVSTVLQKCFDTAYFETLVRICNFAKEKGIRIKKAQQLTGSLAQAVAQTRMIQSG